MGDYPPSDAQPPLTPEEMCACPSMGIYTIKLKGFGKILAKTRIMSRDDFFHSYSVNFIL